MNRLFAFCSVAVVALLLIFSPALAQDKGNLEFKAGTGVMTVVDEGFVGNFTGMDKVCYVASADWYLGRHSSLGARVGMSDWGQTLYDVSTNFNYSFRPSKTFVPYAGLGFGAQNLGLVTDGTKAFVALNLGAKINFSKRFGIFLESRGMNVFDKSTDDVRVNSVFNQFTVGLNVLAK